MVEDHQWDPPSLKPTHLIFGHQTTQTLKWQQRKILSCARFNFLEFGHLLTSFHQQNLSRNVNLEMAFHDTPTHKPLAKMVEDIKPVDYLMRGPL